jgi:hypothetical protein
MITISRSKIFYTKYIYVLLQYNIIFTFLFSFNTVAYIDHFDEILVYFSYFTKHLFKIFFNLVNTMYHFK